MLKMLLIFAISIAVAPVGFGVASTLSCKDVKLFADKGVTKQSLFDFKRYVAKNGLNTSVIAIADYSLSSTRKRFWLLDLDKKTVRAYKVSHGSGKIGGVAYGDPEHDGYLNKCRISSERLLKFNAKKHRKHTQQNMTRPGFFRAGKLYVSSKHKEKRKGRRLVRGWPNIEGKKNALRLHGLSEGVNHKAFAQGVVMHGAWYNQAKVMGRSFGCPAFVPSDAPEILGLLAAKKAIFYSYVPQCSSDFANVLRSLPDHSCTY